MLKKPRLIARLFLSKSVKEGFMRILYLLACYLLVSPVIAATSDGSLTQANRGTAALNSQGSLDINVTKGDSVQISNLDAIVVSNYNGVVSGLFKIASDNVCYYATTSNYSIDMNTDNNFVLINTINSAKTMPYWLRWDDGKNGTYETSFSANSAAAYVGSSNNRTSADCQSTGGTNATIQVLILDLTFNSVTAGLYVDTVHVTLKAQ
jgi:hypothetical protein